MKLVLGVVVYCTGNMVLRHCR